MFQIILTLCLFLVILIPVGKYLYHVADNKKTFLDPICNPIDGFIYRLCGIKKEDMRWSHYFRALIVSNLVMITVGYVILRVQGGALLNPNGVGAMEGTLALNTVISFMTNTNLQHYSGEMGLSYLSQMVVITFMMFTSAASGYAVCMAFIRGIANRKGMGNFYVDMVRIITRVLMPLAIITTLILVWQGVPQTLTPHVTAETVEGTYQDIAVGPIASLEAIKHLGTNGGGFMGANSAAPQENPTIISNIVELLGMMLLPASCVVAFGHMLHKKKGEGRSLFLAMSLLFVIGLGICFTAEKAGNPALEVMGMNQSMGSMEGKEMRFGVAQSALFTTVTTAFTTGTVNNMHDTLTPIGGLVPLMNMMLNVVFGGKGVGFMNMAVYAMLTVFICGLLIGRTPEYLGKKIEGHEMKLIAISIIIHPLLILAFSALAVAVPAGIAGISNPGFHGLTQVLYEFASSAANNGSGFEGLMDNTTFWNITTAMVMFLGRYVAIGLQLAIAGSLLMKRTVNESVGTLKTNNITFVISLVMIVVIFAALTFFPVLSLGPIAEHLILWS
ncbi:MAG: potassium-transporting ATPase subunit KdpA [Cellulosilyticaceae bacterium]